ncbi:tRNA methyltransferase 44 [Actinomortierella ambigua]|nr:tRNA methyltransferase 44 [Actinomortierella ambigua]
MTASQQCALTEVRAVHNLERYSIARSNSDVYYNVIVGPRLRASGKNFHPASDCQEEWTQFLARPLTWLIQQHLSLSLVVRDHLSNRPWFVQLPSVDFSKIVRVVTVETPEGVGQVLENEHNFKYDLSDWSAPIWRLIVVRVESDGSFFLLYHFHHVIGDGRSAMGLTEQLHEQVNMAVLNSANSEPVPTVVPSPKHLKMPLPMELRTDCSPRIKTLVKEAMLALFLPRAIKVALETKYWAGEIDAVPSPNVTQLCMLKLTQEETSLVVQAARKHNNTVQSMLYTAAVFAAQSCFIYPRQLQGEPVEPAQKFSTPVSLRDMLPAKIGRFEQGSYTSELLHTVVLQPESLFWQTAQEYRQAVIQGTQTKAGIQELMEHFGLLKYIPNHPGGWEEFMRDSIAKDQHGRKATIKISNLARGWDVCEIPVADQAYVVEDAVFGQSGGIIGSAFCINVATANGILTATNTWQEPAFHSRESPEWFTREMKRILLQVSEPYRTDLTLQENRWILEAPSIIPPVESVEIVQDTSAEAQDIQQQQQQQQRPRFPEYALLQGRQSYRRGVHRRLLPRRKDKDPIMDEAVLFYDADDNVDDVSSPVSTALTAKTAFAIFAPMHGAQSASISGNTTTSDLFQTLAQSLPFYYPALRAFRYGYLLDPEGDNEDEETNHGHTDTGDVEFQEDSPSNQSRRAGWITLDLLLAGDESNISSKLQYAFKELFRKLFKWGVNTTKGYTKSKVQHDVLVPKDLYLETYARLKEKHAKKWVEQWPERTDPRKFVFEDTAIAAWLIALWQLEREQQDKSTACGDESKKDSSLDSEVVHKRPKLDPESAVPTAPRKQTFLDLGCGNGLLSHILNEEGHVGTGIDISSRKVWELYGPNTHLEAKALIPNEASFEGVDWIIGNHADELAPWVPIIAARSKPWTK